MGQVGTPGGDPPAGGGRARAWLLLAAGAVGGVVLVLVAAMAVAGLRDGGATGGDRGEPAGAAAGAAGDREAADGGGRDRQTARAAGAREIVIDFDQGQVDLVASATGAAEATLERRWSSRRPSFEHRFDGGVLTLVSRCPQQRGLGDRCEVRGRVTVPAGARVRATFGAGHLSATDLDVSSFNARSSAGEVAASFARPPDSVEATAGAGNVELELPRAAYAVDAAASVGMVSVEVADDPASSHRVLARADVGSVRVAPR